METVKNFSLTDRIGGSIMYENDNFSGYETGDENTTGTFSGVSAAGSANGYTTYQMGGSTGSNTEPKNPKKHGGYFRKAMVSVSLGLFFVLPRVARRFTRHRTGTPQPDAGIYERGKVRTACNLATMTLLVQHPAQPLLQIVHTADYSCNSAHNLSVQFILATTTVDSKQKHYLCLSNTTARQKVYRKPTEP